MIIEGSELWYKLRPFAIRDLETILNRKKRENLDDSVKEILLQQSLSDKILKFSFSQDGLLAAISAAENGSVITLPCGVIEMSQQIFVEKDILIQGAIGYEPGYQWINYTYRGTVITCTTPIPTDSFQSVFIYCYSTNKLTLSNLCIFYNIEMDKTAVAVRSDQYLSVNNCIILARNTSSENNSAAIGINLSSSGGFRYGSVNSCFVYAYGNKKGGSALSIFARSYARVNIQDCILVGWGGEGGGTGLSYTEYFASSDSLVSVTNCRLIGKTTGISGSQVGEGGG